MEIKIGSIVRYKPEWCSSTEERQYLHIVIENRLNPVTNKMTRYLIKTINMQNMSFMPTETVDDCMIEVVCDPQERIFIDSESNDIVTESQLRDEFAQLQAENPQEYSFTFSEYIGNCTAKNGTLTEIFKP